MPLKIFILLMLLYVIFPYGVYALDVDTQGIHLELTNPEDIKAAKLVKEKFSSALKHTSNCVNGDVSRRDVCICKHRDVWNVFDISLAKLLKIHPEWKNKFLDYQDNMSGVAISVKALLSTSSQMNKIQCK